MADPRSRRVDEKVREALAFTLIEDVKDPRLDLVTVTGVEVSRDRRHARVFVTAHTEGEGYDHVIRALEHASGRLKRGLAARVRMRFTPDLTFTIDPSVDEGARIDHLLRENVRPVGDEDS